MNNQEQNAMNKKLESKTKEFYPAYAHTVYFWLVNSDNEIDKQKSETSLSLILTFDSAEAQAKYQNEEAHQIFIKESKDLWSKVIVYDSNEIKQ